MKILVTGANGFVATHIIQQLLAEGHAVVGTIRNRAKQPQIFDNVTYVVANLTSAEGWLDAMTDVEAILHVASPLGRENANNPQLIDEAISGVTIVFEAAKKAGVKRIVMTSSQAAATPLAHTTGIIDETFWSDAENPELNAYRLSKLFAEQTAWSLAQQYDLQVTTILPGAIFGPALTENRSSNQVLDQLSRSRLVPSISLEVTDVRDLAALHLLALKNPKTIGERILAKNDDLTFAQISHLYGQRPIVLPDIAIKMSARLIKPLRALVPMLGRKYTHTNQKARSYGWQPREAKQTVLDARNN